MTLAVVRSIGAPRWLGTTQEYEDFEQELVDQFLLAGLGAGLADSSIEDDRRAVFEFVQFLGQPVWTAGPEDADRFLADQRTAYPGTCPACFKDYGKGEVIVEVTDGWGHPGCAPRQLSAAEREFARNKARIESGETCHRSFPKLRRIVTTPFSPLVLELVVGGGGDHRVRGAGSLRGRGPAPSRWPDADDGRAGLMAGKRKANEAGSSNGLRGDVLCVLGMRDRRPDTAAVPAAPDLPVQRAGRVLDGEDPRRQSEGLRARIGHLAEDQPGPVEDVQRADAVGVGCEGARHALERCLGHAVLLRDVPAFGAGRCERCCGGPPRGRSDRRFQPCWRGSRGTPPNPRRGCCG